MIRERFSDLITSNKLTSQAAADLLHVRRNTIQKWIQNEGTAPLWAVDALRHGGKPNFLKHRRDGLPMLQSDSVNTDLGRDLLRMVEEDGKNLPFVLAVLAPVGLFVDDSGV
jgi:hypothetical protein